MAQNDPSNLLYKIGTENFFCLSPSWSIWTLNVTVPPKMAQNWPKIGILGQSTPLEVEKIFFRYSPGDLRSIQLYSKFQIFPLYGSLGDQKVPIFLIGPYGPPSGRQPVSESKIPPFILVKRGKAFKKQSFSGEQKLY